MGRENILTCCGKEYYLRGYTQFYFNPMGIKRRAQDNVWKTFIYSLLNAVLLSVKFLYSSPYPQTSELLKEQFLEQKWLGAELC